MLSWLTIWTIIYYIMFNSIIYILVYNYNLSYDHIIYNTNFTNVNMFVITI